MRRHEKREHAEVAAINSLIISATLFARECFNNDDSVRELGRVFTNFRRKDLTYLARGRYAWRLMEEDSVSSHSSSSGGEGSVED